MLWKKRKPRERTFSERFFYRGRSLRTRKKSYVIPTGPQEGGFDPERESPSLSNPPAGLGKRKKVAVIFSFPQSGMRKDENSVKKFGPPSEKKRGAPPRERGGGGASSRRIRRKEAELLEAWGKVFFLSPRNRASCEKETRDGPILGEGKGKGRSGGGRRILSQGKFYMPKKGRLCVAKGEGMTLRSGLAARRGGGRKGHETSIMA